MKLPKIFIAATLASSVSMQALATQDEYYPEPEPMTPTTEQNNNQSTNVTVSPEQIQNMNNQQIVDFVNSNNLTSNQISELQSHMTNDQNVALNNAIETGDVNVATGDVTTNLLVEGSEATATIGDVTGGDSSATIGDVKGGDSSANASTGDNNNVYSNSTKVEGSWSLGFGNVFAPSSDHPCKASSAWNIGASLGYNGGGQIGRSSQDVATDECLDKIQEHKVELVNLMAAHELTLQDDRQAHERWMKIMEHGLDRNYQTVGGEGKERVVLGPARAVEHGTIWRTELKANWPSFIEYVQQLDALAHIMYTNPANGEFDANAQKLSKPYKLAQNISTTEIDLVLQERDQALVQKVADGQDSYQQCMADAASLLDQFNGQNITEMDEEALDKYMNAVERTTQLVETKQKFCQTKKFAL